MMRPLHRHRSFILDFGCRDLCTLAECFVKAGMGGKDQTH